MRREVVAQALDYVSALTGFGHSDFEAAIARGMDGPKRLYDLFEDHPEALDEAAFIDAVSKNLRQGRILAMVVGDGIRTETEALASLLQSHAGAYFTFVLVELATWKNSDESLLVIPDILTRTVMIERGVVRLESEGVSVLPAPPSVVQRANSISIDVLPISLPRLANRIKLAWNTTADVEVSAFRAMLPSRVCLSVGVKADIR